MIPSGEDEDGLVTDDDDEEEEEDGGRDSPDTRQEVVTVFCVIPSIRTDGAFGGSNDKGNGGKEEDRKG